MRVWAAWGLIPLSIVACGGDDSSGGSGGSSGKDASTGGTDAGVGGNGGSPTGGTSGTSTTGGAGGSSAFGGTSGAGGASGGSSGSSGGGAAGGSGAAGGGGAAGSGGSGGTTLDCSPYVNVTAQAACVTFGDGFCDPLAQCAPIFFPYLGVAGVAECSARFEILCHQLLDAPGSHVQPAFFAAYGTFLKTQACNGNQSAEVEVPENVTTECGTFGDFADGKQCYSGGQCSGAQCAIDENQWCGVCTNGEAGSSCFDTTDCDDDFYCTTANKCAARATVGQSCATAECVESAFCNASQQCIARVGVGSPCAGDGACLDSLVCGVNGQCKVPPKGKLGASCIPFESDSCDTNFDLYCGPGQLCTQHVPPGPGQLCGIYVGDAGLVLEPVCSGGARCVVPPAANGKGTCMLTAADGAACNETNGPFCKINADCIAGTCVVPSATTCPPN